MILVAIGSNLNSKSFGSPEQNCKVAIDILREYFEVIKFSHFYKSEPIPKSKQPWFVNCIVNIRSKISPSNLLDTLLQIESQFGREFWPVLQVIMVKAKFRWPTSNYRRREWMPCYHEKGLVQECSWRSYRERADNGTNCCDRWDGENSDFCPRKGGS